MLVGLIKSAIGFGALGVTLAAGLLVSVGAVRGVRVSHNPRP
ncbi:MAG: hypothetical protein ACLP8S_02400 [Solirubrobacteraceae bacterium]